MANFFEEILNAIGGPGGQDINAPNISLPELAKYNPELYRQVASLNPQLEQALTLGPSAMEGISLDPAARAAQVNALSKLQEISDAGGQDAQFLSDAARLTQDVNSNLAGNTGAIQQNAAVRGMSGGVGELVNKQLAAQQAANRQAQMGLDLNAQAQQRALSALTQGANLGGQMEQQQFGQQAQIASSKDLINKFNLGNQQSILGANVDRGNAAQQFNATTAQNIAGQNTGERNNAQQINRLTPQQQFENQMRQAQLQSDADAANNARKEQRRSGNLGFAGGLVSGAGQIWGRK
jgi:hypothetical protein